VAAVYIAGVDRARITVVAGHHAGALADAGGADVVGVAGVSVVAAAAFPHRVAIAGIAGLVATSLKALVV